MRISDWSSDVCSSDLLDVGFTAFKLIGFAFAPWLLTRVDPRQVLLAATLVMGAASALAAAVTGLDLLVVLRAVQGLSGATLLVAGQEILFWNWAAARQAFLPEL